MREIWGNIIHTSGAKIYSLLIGVFTLALTARFLGPEGRGQMVAITTWINLFSTFGCLSLGQIALHRMAVDQERTDFGRLLACLLLMTLVLTFGGWLIAWIIYVFYSKELFKDLPVFGLLLGFATLPFLLWEQYGSALLMGLERVRIYNRYQILGRTLTVIVILAVVMLLDSGVEGVLGANLLGQIIVAMGGVGFLIEFVKNKKLIFRPDGRVMKMLLVGGAKLHFNAIGTFLFTSANVLILNSYHGAEQTGHFQLAVQLLGVLMIIPQAASMIIYGKVSTLGPNQAWPSNKRVLLQVSIIMIGLSIVSAALAPWGVTLLAGEAFRPSIVTFQWLLLSSVGMTFSTLMAPQWIGRGYFWQAATLTFLIGVINLIINFWLIPLYGIQGAVWAYLGTYLFSILGNGSMAWHCQIQYDKALKI